jgi:hypothetical protein
MLLSHRIRQEFGGLIEVEFEKSDGTSGTWMGSRDGMAAWLAREAAPVENKLVTQAPRVANEAPLLPPVMRFDDIAEEQPPSEIVLNEDEIMATWREAGLEPPLLPPVMNFNEHGPGGPDTADVRKHGPGAAAAASNATGAGQGAPPALLPPVWAS